MGVLTRAGRCPSPDGMTDYFVGVDLGQVRDYTAIAALERFWRRTYRQNAVTYGWDASDEFRLTLRFLERVPLGTPYPAVAARVAKVARALGERGRCALAVDATGVGAAVVDLFREEDLGPNTAFLAVTITDGDRARFGDGRYRVPKVNLVGGLQARLGREELRVAGDLRDMAGLVEEMRLFGAKLRPDGGGPEFSGTKDDRVMALALAVWAAGIADLGVQDGGIPGMPGKNVLV